MRSNKATQGTQATQNNADDLSKDIITVEGVNQTLHHTYYTANDDLLHCTICKAEGDLELLRGLPCETDLYSGVQPDQDSGATQ